MASAETIATATASGEIRALSSSTVEGIQVIAEVATLTAATIARNHGLIRHARA